MPGTVSLAGFTAGADEVVRRDAQGNPALWISDLIRIACTVIRERRLPASLEYADALQDLVFRLWQFATDPQRYDLAKERGKRAYLFQQAAWTVEKWNRDACRKSRRTVVGLPVDFDEWFADQREEYEEKDYPTAEQVATAGRQVLTPREQFVLEQTMQGKKQIQIASLCGCSRQNIQRKMVTIFEKIRKSFRWANA